MKKLTLMLVLCLPVCAFAEKFKGLAPTTSSSLN
jgi:hypothetical protein